MEVVEVQVYGNSLECTFDYPALILAMQDNEAK